MYIAIIVLTLIAAILLIGVVLIQKSKGGGLSSSFAGSNQIMGVRRTNSFIEKVTWSLAGAIGVLAVLAAFCMPTASTNGSRVKAAPVQQQTAPANYDTPVTTTPAATPEQQAPATAE